MPAWKRWRLPFARPCLRKFRHSRPRAIRRFSRALRRMPASTSRKSADCSAAATSAILQFVRAHAQRRAEQYFPLEAILHAYRCGHRILSHWLRDAVVAAQPASIENAISAVADFAIEYTNTISTIMAAEYVAQTRILAEAEGDRRTELLNILLERV